MKNEGHLGTYDGLSMRTKDTACLNKICEIESVGFDLFECIF